LFVINGIFVSFGHGFYKLRLVGFASATSWVVLMYLAYQQTLKPFNPILGKMCELLNHNGVTFLAK
jgi:hypothetical protein